MSERGTYLASLRVENVRCFGERQVLSLTRPDGLPVQWTIILGENGVGKTTLLQLLAIAAGGTHSGRYIFDPWDFEDKPGRPLEFSRRAETEGHIESELRGADGTRFYRFALGDHGLFWQVPPDGPPLVVCGYGAGRRLGDTRLSRRRRYGKFACASLFGDASLLNAEEWLLGEDYAAAKEGRAGGPAGRRLERLKQLLVDLLPDVDDVRVGKPRRRFEPTVEFKTPYGWVPLGGLSLGYQSLVAWMVDFAAAMFDQYGRYSDPLSEPAIVLVDEIDLHLHPKWQRKLIGFLTSKFPNTQFIATAHSPLVVQAADEANVVLLKRDGDHVVIDDDAHDVRNWRIDQILTSDLYGLPTARPPQLDGLIAERRELLTKPKLSAADRKRLREIDALLGDMPAGETPETQRAMALILRAAQEVPQQGGKGKKR